MSKHLLHCEAEGRQVHSMQTEGTIKSCVTAIDSQKVAAPAFRQIHRLVKGWDHWLSTPSQGTE